TYIFSIIGVLTLAVGILGFFLIEEPKLEKSDTPYLQSIVYGFMPKTVRQNSALYLYLLLFALFNISIQIFMPYLILYYEVSLKMTNYVFVMAPAIIIASVVTALWGRVYDKKGFAFSSAFSLFSLLLGYLILIFFSKTLPVFIGSLLMMCGFLSGSAVFGAKIRDLIPKGKAGMLQGVRIVFQVLIPGIIGPMIGAAVLQNAETVQNNDGTTSFIPNANIFLAAFAVAALLSLILIGKRLCKKERHTRLTTPFAREDAWQSHPRPQMQRDAITLLNQSWSLTHISRNGRETALGEIRVPFPPESQLSGIEKTLKEEESFVYSKTFPAPERAPCDRVFLHFGAVDCIATVSLNETMLGTHIGGYLPFSYEITEHLRESNTLSVTVSDETSPLFPYGKQREKRGGMWYTPISGIWQSVWLEITPENPITSLTVTPSDTAVTVTTKGGRADKCLILANGKRYSYSGDSLTFTPEDRHLWSPDDPYLYHFTLTDGVDTVKSYFALRSFQTGVYGKTPCFLLNGKPIFLHGVLDQGYYPDGIFTPASEDGYTHDIKTLKELGFNMIRKHIKTEPETFYYDCDRLGMLVVQDLVNSGEYSFLRDTALPTIGIKRGIRQKASPLRAELFEESAKLTLAHLYNHPSIVAYTIFNEGWGQYDADRLYTLLKETDPTRLYDTTSGWFFETKSDMQSEHVYFKKLALKPSGEKVLFLSEFGGYSHNVEGHVFNLDRTYGYKTFPDRAAFEDALVALYENEVTPAIRQGLCGTVYTQLSDVEDETNGLTTYDRRVLKVSPDRIKALSQSCIRPLRKPLIHKQANLGATPPFFNRFGICQQRTCQRKRDRSIQKIRVHKTKNSHSPPCTRRGGVL
ncbi:MAG: MFS transporter, partial [Clostridia bacterium]|nr:MFS transporter [Clostridia bacterium]